MELEPNGTLRLTIRDCKPDDLGEYRASIYNPYGSDTCMATLRVESKESLLWHSQLLHMDPLVPCIVAVGIVMSMLVIILSQRESPAPCEDVPFFEDLNQFVFTCANKQCDL